MQQAEARTGEPSASGQVEADVKMAVLPPRETAVVGPFTLPSTTAPTTVGSHATDGKRARTPTEQTLADPSSSSALAAKAGDEAVGAPPKKKRKPAVQKVYCHQGASPARSRSRSLRPKIADLLCASQTTRLTRSARSSAARP
jgi:hypothetical protein